MQNILGKLFLKTLLNGFLKNKLSEYYKASLKQANFVNVVERKMKIDSKLKQIITYLMLAVLVLTFTSGSACVRGSGPSDEDNDSWGISEVTSIPQISEDYADEVNALNDAFTDMEDLLDELEQAITAAKDATVDCGAITTDITAAILANDTDEVSRTLIEGVGILALAKPVYERLLAAIEAVQAQLDEINSLKDILVNANQDTSGFDTEIAQDAVTTGELGAKGLLAAMTALENALADAREFLGITDEVSTDIVGVTEGEVSGSYNFFHIIGFAPNASYPRYTSESVVNALYVNAVGSNLTYQWYVSTVNSNVEGSIIPGATSNTYKPLTSTVGTYYYFCQVSSNNVSYLSTPAIEVKIYSVVPLPSLTIISHPISAEYSIGSVAQPLTVAATGTNLTYQWHSKEEGQSVKVIIGATKESYTPPTNALGTVTYFCTVTATESGEKIAANSHSAVVKVITSLMLTSNDNDAYHYSEGNTPTALTVTASGGTPGYTYQWYKNGSPISGENSATYTPLTENGLDAETLINTYYCVVTDSVNGTAQSKTITLVWMRL